MKKPLTKLKKHLLNLLALIGLFFIAFIAFGISDTLGLIFTMIFCLSSFIIVPGFIMYILKMITNKIISNRKKIVPKHHSEINLTNPICKQTETFHLKSSPQELTWFMIVMMTICFFPIGIFFLVKKIIHEKTEYYTNGVKMFVIGCTTSVFLLPIVIYSAYKLRNDLSGIILIESTFGIFLLTGIALIILGLILKNKGNTYENYMTLVTEYQITDLNQIKSELNTTYVDVTNHLQKLIDIELLPGSYIYHKDKEIIVPGISEKIALKCRACNGTTVLYSNEERICIYCGGQI